MPFPEQEQSDDSIVYNYLTKQSGGEEEQGGVNSGQPPNTDAVHDLWFSLP